MINTFSIDDFGESSIPPKHLYKYLVSDRVENVLEGGTVRFTPLMNTNDSFEVRSTFRQFAGPRFLNMLSEQMDAVIESTMDAKILEHLRQIGMDSVPLEILKQLFEQEYGTSIEAALRAIMQQEVDTGLVQQFNDPKFAEFWLEHMGQELMCFSLSESYDSPPMWGHYACNNTGFVIAFDTEHPWFQSPQDSNKTRLHKVMYFDGKLDEPLENPQAAFISKTTHWDYEREWRLYATQEQVDMTVTTSDGPIHLLKFPAKAVDHVIVGSRATEQTISRIRAVLAEKYGGVQLFRARPDPSAPTYQLDLI